MKLVFIALAGWLSCACQPVPTTAADARVSDAQAMLDASERISHRMGPRSRVGVLFIASTPNNDRLVCGRASGDEGAHAFQYFPETGILLEATADGPAFLELDLVTQCEEWAPNWRNRYSAAQ